MKCQRHDRGDLNEFENISMYPIDFHVIISYIQHHTVIITGYYKSDFDSLNDHGLIEVSPDQGMTWIDLNDPAYDPYYLVIRVYTMPDRQMIFEFKER